VLFACALLLMPAAAAAQQEVIAAIQVHGNTLTPTEEVIRASGLAVGDRFSEKLLGEAERRLRESIKLDSVAVLKRYASITDASQILLVIQIDEGPVRVEVPSIDVPNPKIIVPPAARPVVVRRSRLNIMFAPILDAEDGYGFTYGVKIAVTGHNTMRRRVVLPASWGGDKRVGAELQQEFRAPFAPDLRAGAFVQRRTHPFFEEHADRRRVWGRAEWPLLASVRVGTEVAWQSSSLGGDSQDARSTGADVIIDTRVDPMMPHNAVYVRATAERLRFATRSAVRTDVDANGYLGLYRGAVLALRAVREDFSRPAPAYYKSILGGSRNLRGFRAGYRVGDALVAGSAEVRIPATSPLRMAKLGISLLMDVGTVYDKGQRFRDQRLERGIGAGVWATAPVFGISAMVAHGIGADTRVHVSARLTF
jgi:outer membrane protein assembly factor BamA